jgi:hypothetical protein
MIKKIILFLLLSFTLEARSNAYEFNCIPCHRFQPASLEKMFMTYLKTYSGELSLKGSLKEFLKKPNEQNSLMGELFIERFSVKDKSRLTNEELDEAIDTYWELYNVRNKLK